MSDSSRDFQPGPGPARRVAVSTAYEASRVLSTTPCTLKSVTVTNKAASDRFLMLFDATSLPGDGAVPNFPPVQIPSKATGEYDGPEALAVGLVAALSSTEDTLTVATAGDGFFRGVLT